MTGASSGIGTEIARLLAGDGHALTIVARRRDRLDELAGELRETHGIEVTVLQHDLGQSAERSALIGELAADERTVVGICNCAGFGTSGRFNELPLDRELAQVELNVVALVELTHAFVGPMIDHGSGAILNVASVAAFQPLPNLAVYGATKAFVQSFCEAVHTELQGTGVSCTVLCPGPVETEWAEIANAQAVMLPGTKVSAENVASAAVAGMKKGSRSVVPGVVPKAMAMAGRFAPRTALLPSLRTLGRLRDRS